MIVLPPGSLPLAPMLSLPFALPLPTVAAQLLGELGRGDYAVGWFTLTLINAGLAQAKNRSGLVWWLLSLLLGPLATFLIVVLDPAPARKKRS